MVLCTIVSYHFSPSAAARPLHTYRPPTLRGSHTMAAATGNNLRSLIFNVDENGRASLSVLDQLLLPHETKYVPILNVEDAWDAVGKVSPPACRMPLPALTHASLERA